MTDIVLIQRIKEKNDEIDDLRRRFIDMWLSQ